MTSFECSWKRHALGQVSQNADLVPFLQLLLGGQPKTERWHGVNFATVHKNCWGNISQWNTELMRMVDRKRIYWNLICDHPDEKNFINLLIVSLFSPDVHTEHSECQTNRKSIIFCANQRLCGGASEQKLKSRRLYSHEWWCGSVATNQNLQALCCCVNFGSVQTVPKSPTTDGKVIIAVTGFVHYLWRHVPALLTKRGSRYQKL